MGFCSSAAAAGDTPLLRLCNEPMPRRGKKGSEYSFSVLPARSRSRATHQIGSRWLLLRPRAAAAVGAAAAAAARACGRSARRIPRRQRWGAATRSAAGGGRAAAGSAAGSLGRPRRLRRLRPDVVAAAAGAGAWTESAAGAGAAAERTCTAAAAGGRDRRRVQHGRGARARVAHQGGEVGPGAGTAVGKGLFWVEACDQDSKVKNRQN